ncbi:SRPBCC family protein [Streptomonospora wellingtoniae]|uniref:SRPBCC domain-containing protein n=1 Tax=Streptomonospora wellingtoniae TaxID=3075544 RepID=A0ABU2KNC7_9ACTN|nr:SRPBCC domain-containing protein [Streptomonospora sp. DSM 45055]MDT0300775.1 SRPBCC domain-containing protein [Streptomonospora sp. DSM 45055]
MTHNPGTETADGSSYTVTREFDAPVGAVWDAWTEPEAFAKVFNAVPESVVLDVRPGGRFHADIKTPTGELHPVSGSYVEVVRHSRLVEDMGAAQEAALEPQRMAMDFTDLGGGRTALTVHQTCDSPQTAKISRQGTEFLLESCATYLASAHPSA